MSKGKRHNKQYITSSEWVNEWGGKRSADEVVRFKRLPFNCCALSLQPAADPMCSPDGTIFDILNIMPYLKKHGTHPVTGEPLTPKDLFRITFHKNSEGQIHCPVTFKVFTEHTHIVAIRTSGNVYSWEAVEEANVKLKNWIDLIDGTEFTKKDIITIQDPKNVTRRNISEFFHVKSKHVLNEEELEKMRSDPTYSINLNPTSSRIFSQIEKKEEEKRAEDAKKEKAIAAHTSTGAVLSDKSASLTTTQAQAAAEKMKPSSAPRILYSSKSDDMSTMSSSFTSTTVNVVTKDKAKKISEEEKKKRHYARIKELGKKGYVRVHTNMGDLNIELHCDLVPRTCENFIGLCATGYFDGTIFHRSIKNFMIQGGDPTGTGTGGQSLWGKNFSDEFHPKLKHDWRGVVSMANAGPNTNGSQFFIMYKSAPHLDNKHSVFGRVVGGSEVLNAMEKVPTDKSDRPEEEIKIEKTTVFVNPFTEVEFVDPEKEEEERKRKQAEEDRKKAEMEKEGETKRAWFSNPVPAPMTTSHSGVGKYLRAAQDAAAGSKRGADANPDEPKSKKPTGSFDFSSW